MIHFENATLKLGPEPLWQHASFALHPGWKVGLTGANGSGKTSLFRLLQGEYSVDSGTANWPQRWRIASVRQETPSSDRSALDYVLDGDQALREQQQRLAQAQTRNDGHAIAEAHQALESLDAYRAESRAARVLAGLGFSQAELSKSVASFSGGWRMRLNLAQALSARADVLLLDEPTNHLDLDAVIWLERWLKQFDATLIMVSHDREFLDATVNHVLHIEDRSVTYYVGNFSAAERRRFEQRAAQQAAYTSQQAKIAHMQSFVERFRAKASKAKQAQSRLKALQRMSEVAPIQQASAFSFTIPSAEKRPDPIVRLDQASISHHPDQPPHLVALNASLRSFDRIGLLGKNGAGKSTLMRALAEKRTAHEGEIWFSPECQIGYFNQHQVDALVLDDSPIDHLRRLLPSATEQLLRNHLGGFNFQGDRAFESVRHFSGGEKARLALALIVSQKPNLLLLDEPTNHLDMQMREALSLALQDYQGALVVVSHDRGLLRSCVDQFWLVEDHTLKPFDGDLDDYAAHTAAQNQAGSSTKTAAEANASSSPEERKAKKRRDAAIRQQLAPLKKAVSDREKVYDALQQKQQKLQQQLSDSSLYEAEQKTKLQALLHEDETLKKALSEAEQAWLEAEEALEQAEQALND